MIGVAGAGLLSCFLMGEVPLRTDMDETWGLKGQVKDGVMEKNDGDEASA